MNYDEKIVEILRPLGYPIERDFYTGTLNEFLIFNYVDEIPTHFSDDDENYERTFLQVHFFSPNNTNLKKKNIRKILKNQGWKINSVSDFKEVETKLSHLIFEINKTDYIKED